MDDEIRESILSQIKVIDKALALERNAEIFYRRAAERTESETGRSMFQWLARFENSHQSRLMKKREELHKQGMIAGTLPIDTQLEISEADIRAEIREDISDVDVLRMAIENERRAIAYYEKKFTHAVDDSVGEMFRSMVNDEERHIRILTDQLNSLTIDKIWTDLSALEKDIAEM
ncbi:MAG TPA: hypothetical protein ENN67_08850 [Firmicutes bacterium]|nr:hypothetical protein [Bacillota bacterium]